MKYKKLWKIVNGAVRDCLLQHPDYLTEKGKASLQVSVTKRVVGTILSSVGKPTEGRPKAAERPLGISYPQGQGGPRNADLGPPSFSYSWPYIR